MFAISLRYYSCCRCLSMLSTPTATSTPTPTQLLLQSSTRIDIKKLKCLRSSSPVDSMLLFHTLSLSCIPFKCARVCWRVYLLRVCLYAFYIPFTLLLLLFDILSLSLIGLCKNGCGGRDGDGDSNCDCDADFRLPDTAAFVTAIRKLPLLSATQTYPLSRSITLCYTHLLLFLVLLLQFLSGAHIRRLRLLWLINVLLSLCFFIFFIFTLFLLLWLYLCSCCSFCCCLCATCLHFICTFPCILRSQLLQVNLLLLLLLLL